MLVDMHTHTRFGSNCSYMEPVGLVRSAQTAGLGAVCITEHDLLWSASDLEALGREQGFLCLGGMEVATDLGSILVYGYRGPLSQRAEELRRQVQANGGYMVAAHPFRRDPQWAVWDVAAEVGRPLFRLVDALEVFNGLSPRREAEFGLEVAGRTGLPVLGGSDSHAPHTVGRCITRFERPIASEADMVAELRAGRFRAEHRVLGLST
ncbi:MAG: PHP domain-containing protein [Chloroflexi bacterium]|nr:PHP domain-containing protein [Chloroflexota bacterium]